VRPAKAVVFDYGGVLTTPVRDSISAWLNDDDIDERTFALTLKEWLSRDAPDGTPIHLLEKGSLSTAEFERLFAARLRRRDGAAVRAPGVLARLFAEIRPDPAMFCLAEQLRASGVRVAVLSNSWGNTYPRARLNALFDPVLISAEVGLRKPQTEIFELVLSRLGLRAADVVFVDDAVPNLAGAIKVGLHTVLHIDAATTRRAIATHISELAATA
jgi:putative hydrolase of the HAD superfamily